MANLRRRGFIALDGMTLWEACRVGECLIGSVLGIKLEDALHGLASNSESIQRFKEMGFKVFADLKAHKTPQATTSAIKRVARAGADLITVHASGGREAVAAAVKAYIDSGIRDVRTDEPGMGIVCNLVLTSLSKEDCRAIYRSGPEKAAVRLAKLVATDGLFGFVPSPQELKALKEAVGPGLRFVTPGIRSEGQPRGRHQRYATPAEALEWGADYLVIGEEVARARDPLAAVHRIDDAIAILP